MTTLLLDASVWLAARDVDDRFHASARTLVASSPVAALDLTLYEVANVATRRWRDVGEAGLLARLVVAAAGEERLVVATPERIEATRRLAERHEISVYDAAYVACAEEHGWTLVSADLRDLVRPGLAATPDDALRLL